MSHVIRIDMIYFYVDIGCHVNPIDYTTLFSTQNKLCYFMTLL
jgi:hypothetical protein